ncbi:MAG: TIGR04219 family outer membrane beta-barrel protein [Gammaproteobacteria bacterium]|nr:TIGR04219 family outer membrane beta-barrel protein [Gammaproteobacteria bacterium]
MKKHVVVGLAMSSFALVAPANADLLSIEAEAQYWFASANGEHRIGDFTTVGNDWDSDGQMRLSLALEHFLPLIPNAKVSSQSLEFDAAREGQLAARSDLGHETFTLYYAPLNNDLVTVQFGASLMRLRGSINELGNDTAAVSQSISEDIGMAYLRASAGLPLTGFSIVGQGQFSVGSDNDVYDIEAAIRYRFLETVLDGHIGVGYRDMQMQLNKNSSFATDYSFKGPFVNLTVRF